MKGLMVGVVIRVMMSVDIEVMIGAMIEVVIRSTKAYKIINER